MLITEALQRCLQDDPAASCRKEWGIGGEGLAFETALLNHFLPTYDVEFRQTRMLARKDFQEQADQYEIFSAIKLKRTFSETNTIHTSQTDREDGCSEELTWAERYWGIAKTSERLANFVMAGAGDDIHKIRLGRDGIIQGFKEAQETWSGKLPQISYATLSKALDKIDTRLTHLAEAAVKIAA